MDSSGSKPYYANSTKYNFTMRLKLCPLFFPVPCAIFLPFCIKKRKVGESPYTTRKESEYSVKSFQAVPLPIAIMPGIWYYVACDRFLLYPFTIRHYLLPTTGGVYLEHGSLIGPRCKHLAILTERCISQTLGDLDLTPSQSHVVKYLVCTRENPPCQRDLEAFFSLSHPTVSGILSRLEEKGYIVFEADPTDRRRKRVVATEKAKIRADHTKAVLEGIEERMLTGFTPEERAMFGDFLDRAMKNLGCGKCGCQKENKEK